MRTCFERAKLSERHSRMAAEKMLSFDRNTTAIVLGTRQRLPPLSHPLPSFAPTLRRSVVDSWSQASNGSLSRWHAVRKALLNISRPDEEAIEERLENLSIRRVDEARGGLVRDLVKAGEKQPAD